MSRVNVAPGISTTTFADIGRITCCASGANREPGLSSVGYWSANDYETSVTSPLHNFTVKWIVGRPIPQQFYDIRNMSHFIWQEPPSIAAISCQPIMETVDASVTVDMISDIVLNFSISGDPTIAASAWSDNYETHNTTDPAAELGEGHTNVTVR